MKHKDTSPTRIDELLSNLMEFPRAEGQEKGNPDVQSKINTPTKERLMPDYVARPELDAKLETIEARMDGRLARIEDSIKRISDDGAATREGISSLKTTIVVTAIGAALTVLFGIAAFNATLLSNMTSSFDSGRDTEKAASEAKAEISSSVAEIKQMVQEMKQQQEEIKP